MTAKKATEPTTEPVDDSSVDYSDELNDAVMTATGLDKDRVHITPTTEPGTLTFEEHDKDDNDITHHRTFRVTETTPTHRHNGGAEVTPEGQRADMPTPEHQP